MVKVVFAVASIATLLLFLGPSLADQPFKESHVSFSEAQMKISLACKGTLSSNRTSDGGTTWNCRPFPTQGGPWGCSWTPSETGDEGDVQCFTDFQ